MNLATFIASQTARMKAFETHWKTKIEPNMTPEDLLFWETKATAWEWIEALEESGI